MGRFCEMKQVVRFWCEIEPANGKTLNLYEMWYIYCCDKGHSWNSTPYLENLLLQNFVTWLTLCECFLVERFKLQMQLVHTHSLMAVLRVNLDGPVALKA